MIIAVVGLGSMGKRRIRLINEFLNDTDYTLVGIDSNIARCEEFREEFSNNTYATLLEARDAEGGLDCVFVSTSPLSHYPIIKEALILGADVFTEINLVPDGYDELISLARELNKVLFLSSTHLYNPEVKEIIKQTSDKRNLTYNFHIGQYLPDWHPWESYKNFFVANSRTNACREIYAINLPWIQKAFGKITDVLVEKKKSTSLDLDYPDTYIVTLRHENNNSGVFIMDVVCRRAINHFEVFNEDLYLTWEGKANSLQKYNFETKEMENLSHVENINQDSRYASFVVENNYANEIRAFFECVEIRKNECYNFENDKITLDWIDIIEGNKH